MFSAKLLCDSVQTISEVIHVDRSKVQVLTLVVSSVIDVRGNHADEFFNELLGLFVAPLDTERQLVVVECHIAYKTLG